MKKPRNNTFRKTKKKASNGYTFVEGDNKLFSGNLSFTDREKVLSAVTETDESDDNSVGSVDGYRPENGLKRKRNKVRIIENDDIEENYEREMVEEDEPDKKKTRRLLPIKSGGKIIHRIGLVEEDLYDPKKAAADEKKTLEQEEQVKEDEDEFVEPVGDRDLSQPVSTAELLAWRENALAKCRYKIGLLSSKILEDPQENVGKLAILNEMLYEYRPEILVTVKKLASVSMLEIFKDILPEYQIKHQDDLSVKLKKETLRLQTFEKSLLKQYRVYLVKLEKLAAVLVKKKGDTRIHSEQILGLGRVALNCLCELLVTHPYFNFSNNTAQVLIPYLNHPKPDVRARVATCITQIFKEDKRGELTLFIVRQINQLVKSKTNAVHSEVVSVFLSLRLKDINLDQEKESELKQKQFKSKRSKLLMMSKKEKKAKKRLKDLEQELLETKAEESKQEKQKTLTEVTKVVFMVYFRILKKNPSSKLLCATLDGIAKFAHLINLEFYQDVVYILSRLMNSEKLDLHQQLLCIQTVFTMLSGYGEALNIDSTKFYTHLYCCMISVHAGKTFSEMELLLKTLDTVVIKRRKRITQQRSLAYIKRLATVALQLLHNGSLGCLGLIRNVMQLNTATDILLELDSAVGQGIFLPELEDPEHCNAGSTALYELTALRRYYHPTVRKMAEHIIKNVPTSGDGSLPPDLSKKSSLDLFKEFNPLEMVFKPAIPAPEPVKIKAKWKPHSWIDHDLEEVTKKILSTGVSVESTNIYEEVERFLKSSAHSDPV